LDIAVVYLMRVREVRGLTSARCMDDPLVKSMKQLLMIDWWMPPCFMAVEYICLNKLC